jgi:DNA invertase Pin-like site-specific DNA recombinase
MKAVAAYVRVSTYGQNEESQVNEIEAYCIAHGLRPTFFIDKATGTNLDRPAFEELEAALFHGHFDTVLIYKIDRLSRSLSDGIAVLSKWLTNGIRLVATSQRFDFSGTVGKMMASLLLSVAEMENDLRRERQAIGVANAKAKGVYRGRAVGATKANPAKAVKLRSEGKKLHEIAAILGVGMSAVQRYLKAADKIVAQG